MDTAPDFATWLTTIRRHLHRHPELSGREFETARFISGQLEALGIAHRLAGETGVVAEIGPQGAEAVALRADIDALPIQEETGLAFASNHPGVMHACGHDGHVAMLLGAARLLAARPLPCRVVLLFQPAEEGEGGARTMIEAGALDHVRIIFAGHIDHHHPVGTMVAAPGIVCAATDEFTIELSGCGGHAAKPHEAPDTILAAATLVTSLQALVSRETDPFSPAVVTVGSIQGGTAPNVIADRVVLRGTIRSLHPEVRSRLHQGVRRMARHIGETFRVDVKIAMEEGYPPVDNDPLAAALAREALAATEGVLEVLDNGCASMGGEDFAFYLERVPGCLVRFGARPNHHAPAPAHSPRFDFNEAVLPIGARFLAQVACIAAQRLKLCESSEHAKETAAPRDI